MSRAPDSLAPPWLPRQRRRHVDQALRKLIRRDACSICGAPFEPNTGTAFGFDASGAVALAGECCIGKLTEIFGLGFDFPLSTGTNRELADIVRRSGVDNPLQISPSDGPWKDDDRCWFEGNPSRSHRMRLPFATEFDEEMAAAGGDHTLLVLVRQVEPGKRIRARLYHNTELKPPDDEAVAHAFFEVAAGREAMPADGAAFIALIEKYKTRESDQ